MAELDVKKVLAHLVEDGGTVVVKVSNISSLPVLVTHDKIREEHVSVKEDFSNPSAQIADWKVSTANGSLEIDVDKTNPTTEERAAAISGTTDLTLYLNPTDTKGKSGTTVINATGISSLPYSISNSEITSNHVAIKSILSNPSAQTADWTVETTDGGLTIKSDSANAIEGSTDITLYLTIASAGSQN